VSTARKTLWPVLLISSALIVACGGDREQPVAVMPADHRAEQVTDLFSHLDEGKQPGAAVMVIQDDEVVYRRGFGYANLENGERITPESTFRLASVSKQFTAAALLVLAEQGKLDIDDPLVDYLPDMTAYPGVTLRHLMNHTSGIPDYYDEIPETDYLPGNEEVQHYIAGMAGPDFAPGERYEYSNPAYELMARVIEVVSGMRFADFMKQYVFEPAGMHGALIHDEREPAIPNRVYGYDTTADGFVLNDYHYLNGITGSGAMYATLEDFYAWDQALDRNRVISEATLAEAYTKSTLNDGSEIDYGLGWRLDSYLGHPRAAHGGSWVGFRTGIARYPDANLTIVVLANDSAYEPGKDIDRISDIYLPVDDDTFVAASSVDRVQRQHRRLPDDDIWWAVYGQDMAWNFKNLHQLFPTVNVYRHGAIRELEQAPDGAIAGHPVDTPKGSMTLDEFVHSDQSTVMGVIVLHHGKVAYESYPRMHDYEMPVYWSVAKSFVGTVIRIMEERGEVDVGEPIDAYLPALASSDLAGIPVRDLLDMASGLDCGDEYKSRDACYYRYSMAIGDGFRTADAPDNPYDFAKTLTGVRVAEPGTAFSYSGLDTFVLAWLVEELTGLPFQDALTREIWYHIGAESNASYIAPRYGIPVTHGGFMARLRDVARLGLLFTPSWPVVSDRQIISDAHIDFLQTGGRPQLLAAAGAQDDGVKFNIYQWDAVYENGDIYKGGWAGQGLLVNPQRDVVAVFTGYFKEDQSEVRFEPLLRQVLDSVYGSP